jgi:opine dehydrogenase
MDFAFSDHSYSNKETAGMLQKERVTVIGGGNGGFAAASDLTIRGHEVLLYEHPDFSDSIKEVMDLGGIDLETLPSSGLTGGFAKLHTVTTDIEVALDFAEIVLVVAPAFAFENLARTCAPFVHEGQIFMLSPGNFGGSLFFSNTLTESGCNKRVRVAELECMMYACRKKDARSVWIRGYKRALGCGVFPDSDSTEVMQRLRNLYPNLINRGNVLEVGMCNPNMIVHVPTMVFSASCIDHEEDRLFYVQCLSESVGKVIDRMDSERMQMNTVPGFHIPPLRDVIFNWYAEQGAHGRTIQEIQSTNPIFKWSKMPTSLTHRYLSEDVPYGLIPMEQMLDQFGLEHTAMSAMANIAGVLTGVDYYEHARTPATIGINGMTSKEILDFLKTGTR